MNFNCDPNVKKLDQIAEKDTKIEIIQLRKTAKTSGEVENNNNNNKLSNSNKDNN